MSAAWMRQFAVRSSRPSSWAERRVGEKPAAPVRKKLEAAAVEAKSSLSVNSSRISTAASTKHCELRAVKATGDSHPNDKETL